MQTKTKEQGEMTSEYTRLAHFEILNESSGELRDTDAGIVIRTSGGSMWGKGKTCKNLLLTPGVVTDFRAELSARLLPRNNAEQVGIILYRDADNYVKLVREMVNGKQVIVLAKEIEGSPEPLLIEEFSPSELVLAATVKNGTLTAEWKSAGATEWEKRVLEYWLGPGAEVRVGIVVHGSNDANTALCSSLKVHS
jgi:hypothetical protein